MNRSELIVALAQKSNIPEAEAQIFVSSMFDMMKDYLLQGNRVEIRGFGSFFVKDYKGYKGRNPKTGESVSVKQKKLPFFRCGKELKDLLNER